MVVTGDCIAVDWGTTNRRAYRLSAGGAVVDRIGDDRGVLAVPSDAYPAEIAELRARLGELPVVAAGMVGSTRGWQEVPYVPAPARLADIAAGARTVAPGVTLLPGVSLLDGERADVMRGEEVQVLGAIAAGLAGADALFCQPGTHNKWITVADGAITEFATAMTGEIFALLRGGGILAGMLDGPVSDDATFRDGVRRGLGAIDVPVALFEVRASVLLGRIATAHAAARASGILIGAAVGARPALAQSEVKLLARGTLATLYAAAIEVAGGRATVVDDRAAFVAGIHALREMLP
jgi:2-dehydro-3-deoxygalactonokinase